MSIVTEVTNVIIICLSIFRQISGNMYISCGTKNRLCHIDSSKVEQTLGITGCDSVGAFSGRRKGSALTLVMKRGRLHIAMEGLSKTWGLSEELFTLLQELMCKIYASQTSLCNVNDLRYRLFRDKKGDVDSGQLPSCQDTLMSGYAG